MSCSILDRLKTDLRMKNLTNTNLEAPLSKEREVSRYVSSLTSLAKKNYKIDLGSIFSVTKTSDNIKLDPNIPAIEAIERSQEYEAEQAKIKAQKAIQNLDITNVPQDYEGLQKINSQPNTLTPHNLPDIEITC